MKAAVALLLAAAAGGCATVPEKTCDLGEVGLSVLLDPPTDTVRLEEQIRNETPAALDEERLHWVWLQSRQGDLYLCSYPRRPVVTGHCGATVYNFAKTPDGYEGTTISVVAC